jgi:hypothetical protein
MENDINRILFEARQSDVYFDIEYSIYYFDPYDISISEGIRGLVRPLINYSIEKHYDKMGIPRWILVYHDVLEGVFNEDSVGSIAILKLSEQEEQLIVNAFYAQTGNVILYKANSSSGFFDDFYRNFEQHYRLMQEEVKQIPGKK